MRTQHTDTPTKKDRKNMPVPLWVAVGALKLAGSSALYLYLRSQRANREADRVSDTQTKDKD